MKKQYWKLKKVKLVHSQYTVPFIFWYTSSILSLHFEENNIQEFHASRMLTSMCSIWRRWAFLAVSSRARASSSWVFTPRDSLYNRENWDWRHLYSGVSFTTSSGMFRRSILQKDQHKSEFRIRCCRLKYGLPFLKGNSSLYIKFNQGIYVKMYDNI